MPEVGLDDVRSTQRSGSRTRDFSPDSVILTGESNFSLFSSASASAERCSFASDVLDHDSLISDVSQHLAGHAPTETSSGPDSDPKKSNLYRNSRLIRKVEKAKVRKGNYNEEGYDQSDTLDSARNSFSQALKECQDRRSRSEALFRKQDRRRPASLDLNNHHVTTGTSSSPLFGAMKKSAVMTRRSGTVLSPGTPNYGHTSVGSQKGWSSERIPLHTNANRRNVSTALYPFGNGRTLPSKWEDAERWIFSPVSGDGVVRSSLQQPQRRPKSKSGPLGPPGFACNSLHSPVVPMFEAGCVRNLMAGSPFSAGLISADGFSVRSGLGSGGAGMFAKRVEPYMARSVSVHGCSEIVSQSTPPGPQGEKFYPGDNLESDKDASTNISRVVSRRDMATQMSPEHSCQSSPRSRLSFSLTTPSILPIVELESVQSSKSDVRDVQVDERVTVTRWSKKHKPRFPGKVSENLNDWRRKAVEVRSSAWEVSEAAKSISKMKREEAKVSAWENLQKAKAEAAIRKLEMKLEKKRSSSMDKIMNKLRLAQKKAQEMRSSMLTNQPHQVARTSYKIISFRRTRQISSLSGCFTCHAF